MHPWVKTRQIQGTCYKAKKHKRNELFRNINLNVLPTFDLDTWCCVGKASGNFYDCITILGVVKGGFCCCFRQGLFMNPWLTWSSVCRPD